MGKVLITGISGQDGSYLSEYMLELGHEVFGIVRRNSIPEHQESRIANKDVHTYYGDLTDQASLERVLKDCEPDYIFNLAAQSHVRVSFDIPQYTAQVNGLGVLNLLEAYRNICPYATFYQASSSEMFGNQVDDDGFQRLSTPMIPVSPYGSAKLYAYNITNTYRVSYGLNIYNGILFNHESPRRGSNFVTNKVIKGAVMIKHGLLDHLELGNLNSSRDWGHSYDYVRAMYEIVHQDEPNVIVSTMQTYSVKDMIDYVAKYLNIELPIVQNPKFFRPNELHYLRGDSTYIRSLGWEPKYNFESLMNEMIDFWVNYYGK